MSIRHSVYTSTVLRSDLIRYMKWKHLWGEASKQLDNTKSCNVFIQPDKNYSSCTFSMCSLNEAIIWPSTLHPFFIYFW